MGRAWDRAVEVEGSLVRNEEGEGSDQLNRGR